MRYILLYYSSCTSNFYRSSSDHIRSTHIACYAQQDGELP